MSTMTTIEDDLIAEEDAPTAEKGSVRRSGKVRRKPGTEDVDPDPGRPAGLRGFLGAGLRRFGRGTPVVAEALVTRLVVIAIDLILVMITAVAVIPMIGVYLHDQAQVVAQQLTVEGMIAIWAMPFGFVTAVVTFVEICAMRALWRVGSRRIAKVHRARLGEDEATPPKETTRTKSGTTRGTNGKQKRKRK